ncbi:hypothetical protein IPF37_03185 [bacterium]|nr:MAG: hypothetical protein IPF37_03185 [bacterium]
MKQKRMNSYLSFGLLLSLLLGVSQPIFAATAQDQQKLLAKQAADQKKLQQQQAALAAKLAADAKKRKQQQQKDAQKKSGQPSTDDTQQDTITETSPQGKLSKDLFTDLPALKLNAIDLACGGDNPLIYGLTPDGKIFQLAKDWSSWNDISSTTPLANFSVGADGILWGLDKDGTCWYREQETWQQLSKPNISDSNASKQKSKTPKPVVAKFVQLYVGNKNEIWARDSDNVLWRKQNPVTTNSTWQKIPDEQGVFISCGGDGKVLLATNDQTIRTFNRFQKKWKTIIKPTSFGMGNPFKISIKDKLNTLFLDYSKQAWLLKAGASGLRKNDWLSIESSGSFKDISIGYDGTIVAIDNKDRLITYKPGKDAVNALNTARGPVIRSSQMVRIITGPNSDFMRAWTNADSYYDQNAQADPPANFVQILVGSLEKGMVTLDKKPSSDALQSTDSTTEAQDTTSKTSSEAAKQLAAVEEEKKKKAEQKLSPQEKKKLKEDNTINLENTKDKRQDIGCFFSITKAADDNSTDVINFGDTVSIWSLYAVEGNDKKAGSLGKEWKWWTSDGHYLMKPNQQDIHVSLINHPHAQDGWQTFKLVSPYNQTGPIRSNDTVIIQSMAPQSQEKNVWVNQYNWMNADASNPSFFELAVASKDVSLWAQDFYGQQDLGGAQYFTLQAINSESDVPDTGISANIKNPKQAARDVYNSIKSDQFWADKSLATTTITKSLIKSELTSGLGVVRELRNDTDYPIKTSGLGICPLHDSILNKKYELLEPLILEGFAKEPSIADFGPDRMITLNKMFSRGFAWLDTSLEKPGQATISFLARAGDSGGIEVVFDTKGGTAAKWHIIIGGSNNTTSQILLDGKLIAEAPLARAVPGRFIPYWVSVNNGLILVGIGTPGTGIFMSGLMPEAVPVNRVGLSSHDGPVDYTEVQLGQAVHAIAEEEIYSKVQHDIVLSANSKTTSLIDIPVRLPNEASVAFTAQAEHDLTVVLQNKKGKNNYKIIIDADAQKLIKIERNGKIVHQLLTASLPTAHVSKDTPTDFWVSIFGGALMVGQGKIGDNLLIAWQDPEEFSDITQVGFAPSNHEQKISNIEVAPPVSIGLEKKPVTYEQQIRRFPYKGTMTVHRPFRYEFIQTDVKVTMKDMVSGKTFSVLSTPQQGASYVFMINIDQIGLPSIQLMQQPEDAPGKITLEKGAILREIEAHHVAEIANAKGSVLEAAGQATLQAGGSFGMSPNMIMSLAGLALSASGIGMATGAASIKAGGQTKSAHLMAEASKARADAQFGFRAHNSYVYVEQPSKEFGASETIPAEAQQNAATVSQLLGETKKFTFSDPNNYSILLKIYIDILRNITHPFVVDSKVIKDNIFDDLDQARQYYPNNPDQLMVILDVLVRAYSNSYLVDEQNKRDKAAKDRWYFTIADIGKAFLNASLQDPDFVFTIPPLYGEYLWIPWEVKKPNIGWLIFEVQGQSDAFVCFSEDAVSVRNTDTELYELVIGGWENSKNVIRIKSLGRSATEIDITKSALKTSQLSQRDFKAYWVGFNDGMISMGSGDQVGQNIIAEWQDPYPWKTIKFIGISTWDVPLQFRNVYTAEGIEASKTMTPQATPLPQPEALSEQEQAALAAYQGAQVAGSQNITSQPQNFKEVQAQGFTPQQAYKQGDDAQTGYLMRPGVGYPAGYPATTGYPTGYPQQMQQIPPIVPQIRTH